MDRDNNQRPDYWSPDTHVTRASGGARNGAYTMRHAASDNASYLVAQRLFSITAGKPYSFSGSVRIPTTGDAFSVKLEILWSDGTNAVIGRTPIKTYTTHTSGAWTVVNTTVTAPAGTANAYLRIIVTSLNAEVFMDSFTVRP